MGLSGLPDWHAPLHVGERRVYPAYEQPGVFLVPPVRWVAVGSGSDPAFRVDVYQQDRHEEGLAEFGLLTVRYTAAYDLEELYGTGVEGLPGARFLALAPESGIVRLTSPAEIPLPGPVTSPQALADAGVSSAATVVRLDGPASDLVVGALRRGLATIRGLAWLVVRGVATRVPGSMTVDLDAFTSAAVRQGTDGPPADAPVSLDDLRRRVTDDPAAFGIRTTAEVDGNTRSSFTEAALDRLLARVAHLVPSPDAQPGVWVGVGRTVGEATWDLAEPLAVPRFLGLDADPLGPLRSMTAAELETTVLRRHVAPAVRTGRHRVTFCPTVVLPQFGLAEQMVEVSVPARPPTRPQTIREVVPLVPGTPTASVAFRMSPSEPLRYEWALTSVLASSTGARVHVGPTRTADSGWNAVRPDDTGLRYVAVEASPALLAEASVHVEATTSVDDEPWVAAGTLDAQRPAGLLVLPPGAPDPDIAARATTPDGLSRATTAAAVPRLRLDPFSFPGTGRRDVHLALGTGHEPDGAGVVVELTPEDATDDPRRHGTVLLTAGRPEATWHWYALSPFRGAVRWRRRGADTWSEPTEGPVVVGPEPLLEAAGGALRRPEGT